MPLVVSRITPGSPVSKFLRLLISSIVIPSTSQMSVHNRNLDTCNQYEIAAKLFSLGIGLISGFLNRRLKYVQELVKQDLSRKYLCVLLLSQKVHPELENA